ncbi:hypothetical protein BGZ96_004278 [Linnemannia gamsii]|uniref:Uncharacterized protein n=1 Tax=Linnemannia gamsii TaxID=64522 RepID=A0ABQ7K5Z4_9FUNG|nr:hypothetical protein BGZ96_004278 [Linnemannia gamsii]
MLSPIVMMDEIDKSEQSDQNSQATPPVIGGLVAVPPLTAAVAGDLSTTPAGFGGFSAAPAAPAPAALAFGGVGPLPVPAPVAAVGEFGVVPTAAAAVGDGFGAAAPVTPAVILGEHGTTAAVAPAAAFEGFGVAPATVAIHGFGLTPVDQVADPYQELDVELSEPLFPDHLNLADVIVTKTQERITPESNKARKEYSWILAQHAWHLIRINPGLTRLDSSECSRVNDIHISGDFIFATLRHLKHLKNLNVDEQIFKSLNFWRLWDALTATAESLSIMGQFVPSHVFPLPDPLPEVNTSLKVLLVAGSTTVNGLLTLLVPQSDSA